MKQQKIIYIHQNKENEISATMVEKAAQEQPKINPNLVVFMIPDKRVIAYQTL